MFSLAFATANPKMPLVSYSLMGVGRTVLEGAKQTDGSGDGEQLLFSQRAHSCWDYAIPPLQFNSCKPSRAELEAEHMMLSQTQVNADPETINRCHL